MRNAVFFVNALIGGKLMTEAHYLFASRLSCVWCPLWVSSSLQKKFSQFSSSSPALFHHRRHFDSLFRRKCRRNETFSNQSVIEQCPHQNHLNRIPIWMFDHSTFPSAKSAELYRFYCSFDSRRFFALFFNLMIRLGALGNEEDKRELTNCSEAEASGPYFSIQVCSPFGFDPRRQHDCQGGVELRRKARQVLFYRGERPDVCKLIRWRAHQRCGIAALKLH